MQTQAIDILANTSSYEEYLIKQDILGLRYKIQVDPEYIATTEWSRVKEAILARVIDANSERFL